MIKTINNTNAKFGDIHNKLNNSIEHLDKEYDFN